ncbi:hypothetical protein Hanom_Chr16g01478841 [Helianthus anomalus]
MHLPGSITSVLGASKRGAKIVKFLIVTFLHDLYKRASRIVEKLLAIPFPPSLTLPINGTIIPCCHGYQ